MLRYSDENVDKIIDTILDLNGDIFTAKTVSRRCNISPQSISYLMQLMKNLGYVDVRFKNIIPSNGKNRDFKYKRCFKKEDSIEIKKTIHRISRLFKYKKKGGLKNE